MFGWRDWFRNIVNNWELRRMHKRKESKYISEKERVNFICTLYIVYTCTILLIALKPVVHLLYPFTPSTVSYYPCLKQTPPQTRIYESPLFFDLLTFDKNKWSYLISRNGNSRKITFLFFFVISGGYLIKKTLLHSIFVENRNETRSRLVIRDEFVGETGVSLRSFYK